MNTYQRFKNNIFATVKGKFLIGRRMVLNFPESEDKKISIIMLPDWRSTSFKIQEVLLNNEPKFNVILCGPDKEEYLLATFKNEADAVNALNKIKRKFTKPIWTFTKIAFLLIVFAVFAEWMVRTPVFKIIAGKPIASNAQSGMPGMPGMPGGVNVDALRKQYGIPSQGLPSMPGGVPQLPQAQLPGASGQSQTVSPGAYNEDTLKAMIKQKYGVDITTVPGGKEALSQALGQMGQNPQAVNGANSNSPQIPQAGSSQNDTKATINLLEQSK